MIRAFLGTGERPAGERRVYSSDLDALVGPDAILITGHTWHSRVVAARVGWHREQAENFVLLTNNPYHVDALLESEVFCVAWDGDALRCASLAEHPDWERWVGKLAPGEFWASVGEDWVLHLPASSEDQP